MRLALVFVIIIHGLIHLLGFVKAFDIVPVDQLTQPVSKPIGLLWLAVLILWLLVAAGLLLQRDWWWMLAIPVACLSQFLIILQWNDAKFGTALNILILIAAMVALANWKFYASYLNDTAEILIPAQADPDDLITENDLQTLPEPVKKYLTYIGAVHTSKLRNVKILFDGEMRGMGQDWFPFQSEQYNTFDTPNRLFFITSRMKGMKVPGYHTFRDGTAKMTIKLFGIYPIVHHEGREMDIAETVTILNDMCILAPAALVYAPIRWETIDSLTVRATFTHKGITVSARLLFNAEGQLINFISEDRYDISGKKPIRYTWSTPMSHYKQMHSIKVPTYGEAVWHYPDGAFVYGKFYLREISYNANRS